MRTRFVSRDTTTVDLKELAAIVGIQVIGEEHMKAYSVLLALRSGYELSFGAVEKRDDAVKLAESVKAEWYEFNHAKEVD